MMEMVFPFDELPPEQQLAAGGKGGTLARLYQAGYPVPEGLVILPAGVYIIAADAFEGVGVGVHFWSSTEHGSDAGLPTLHKDYAAVLRLVESKSIAASVRCVMD
jgi:pyruvate,water dikinase